MLICTFALLMSAIVTPAQSVADDAVIGARLDAMLRRLEPLGFSGAALVRKDGEVLLSAGYGLADRDAETSFTDETLLPVGSISKHFTAVLILSLVGDGELSVDDTLGELLPGAPPDKAGITVRQLLTHTSGMPESIGVRAGSRDAFVAEALRAELVAPPGAEVMYSNLGFGLLAAIAERAGGEPFPALLRERVFAPAGMASTGVGRDDWDRARMAHGYVDGLDTGPLDVGGNPWHLLGAGGVQTTLRDMERWERAFEANAVLSAELYERLRTADGTALANRAFGYGLGVFRTPRGTTRIGHDGSNDVFGADWRRFVDEDASLFVASNDATMYAMDVADVLERILFGEDVEPPPLAIRMPAERLARYAGAYRLPGGGAVDVRVAGGGLAISTRDPGAGRMLHAQPASRDRRRDELLLALPAATRAAFDGDYAALHERVDPHAPLADFSAMHAELFAQLRDEHGELEEVAAFPGLNRFGEIGIVTALRFERGEVLIEYSFARIGVGAVRFLTEPPARVVRPVSAERMIAYELATGATQAVEFVLDDAGAPTELVLRGAAGRGELRATRRD